MSSNQKPDESEKIQLTSFVLGEKSPEEAADINRKLKDNPLLAHEAEEIKSFCQQLELEMKSSIINNADIKKEQKKKSIIQPKRSKKHKRTKRAEKLKKTQQTQRLHTAIAIAALLMVFCLVTFFVLNTRSHPAPSSGKLPINISEPAPPQSAAVEAIKERRAESTFPETPAISNPSSPTP